VRPALADAADDGGVRVGRAEAFDERGGALGGERHQKPAGRLRVEEEAGEFLAHGRADGHVFADVSAVRLVAAREQPVGGERERAGDERDGCGVNLESHAACAGHLPGVAEQREAGHVRRRVRARLGHRQRGPAPGEEHRVERGARHLLGSLAELDAGRDDAGAEGLRQDERVARARAAVGDDAARVNGARHGVAEHDLLVVYAVAADERHALLLQNMEAAAHDLGEDVERDALLREAGDGERRQRRAAHRPHVVDGIQGGDTPVVERVVHNGREEVHGLDEREVVRETVYPRVVGRLDADDQVRVVGYLQPAQHLGQFARRELRRSTRARDHLRETHLKPPFKNSR
jgi:hypothetical protein